MPNQKFRSGNFLDKLHNLLSLFSQFLLKLVNVALFCLQGCSVSTVNKQIDIADIWGESFNLSLEGALRNTLETFFLALIFGDNGFHFFKFFLLLLEVISLSSALFKVIDISYVSLKTLLTFCKDCFDF
jgi:hypothetical protein